jgi:ribosomal protein S21
VANFGVRVEGGDFNQALGRFVKQLHDSGLKRELKRRKYHVPRSEARKVKSLRARRRKSR